MSSSYFHGETEPTRLSTTTPFDASDRSHEKLSEDDAQSGDTEPDREPHIQGRIPASSLSTTLGANQDSRQDDGKISDWEKEVSRTTGRFPNKNCSPTPSVQMQNAEDYESSIVNVITFRSDSDRMDAESPDIYADSESLSGGEISREPLPWDSTGAIMAKLQRYYEVFLGLETLKQLSKMYPFTPVPEMRDNEASEDSQNRGSI